MASHHSPGGNGGCADDASAQQRRPSQQQQQLLMMSLMLQQQQQQQQQQQSFAGPVQLNQFPLVTPQQQTALQQQAAFQQQQQQQIQQMAQQGANFFAATGGAFAPGQPPAHPNQSMLYAGANCRGIPPGYAPPNLWPYVSPEDAAMAYRASNQQQHPVVNDAMAPFYAAAAAAAAGPYNLMLNHISSLNPAALSAFAPALSGPSPTSAAAAIAAGRLLASGHVPSQSLNAGLLAPHQSHHAEQQQHHQSHGGLVSMRRGSQRDENRMVSSNFSGATRGSALTPSPGLGIRSDERECFLSPVSADEVLLLLRQALKQPSSDLLAPVSYPCNDGDPICNVCFEPERPAKVALLGDCIVQCKDCSTTVHRRCYGVHKIFTYHGDSGRKLFLCDPCRYARLGKEPGPCVLCLRPDGIKKQTEDSTFVHIICALTAPEKVRIGDFKYFSRIECLKDDDSCSSVKRNHEAKSASATVTATAPAIGGVHVEFQNKSEDLMDCGVTGESPPSSGSTVPPPEPLPSATALSNHHVESSNSLQVMPQESGDDVTVPPVPISDSEVVADTSTGDLFPVESEKSQSSFCASCQSSEGYLLCCSQPGCHTKFHPHCLRELSQKQKEDGRANSCLEIRLSSPAIRVFCPVHLPPTEYCFCRRPYELTEDAPLMVGCDFCGDWVHGACLPLGAAEEALKADPYICPRCSQQRLQLILMDREWACIDFGDIAGSRTRSALSPLTARKLLEAFNTYNEESLLGVSAVVPNHLSPVSLPDLLLVVACWASRAQLMLVADTLRLPPAIINSRSSRNLSSQIGGLKHTKSENTVGRQVSGGVNRSNGLIDPVTGKEASSEGPPSGASSCGSMGHKRIQLKKKEHTAGTTNSMGSSSFLNQLGNRKPGGGSNIMGKQLPGIGTKISLENRRSLLSTKPSVGGIGTLHKGTTGDRLLNLSTGGTMRPGPNLSSLKKRSSVSSVPMERKHGSSHTRSPSSPSNEPDTSDSALPAAPDFEFPLVSIVSIGAMRLLINVYALLPPQANNELCKALEACVNRCTNWADLIRDTLNQAKIELTQGTSGLVTTLKTSAATLRQQLNSHSVDAVASYYSLKLEPKVVAKAQLVTIPRATRAGVSISSKYCPRNAALGALCLLTDAAVRSRLEAITTLFLLENKDVLTSPATAPSMEILRQVVSKVRENPDLRQLRSHPQILAVESVLQRAAECAAAARRLAAKPKASLAEVEALVTEVRDSLPNDSNLDLFGLPEALARAKTLENSIDWTKLKSMRDCWHQAQQLPITSPVFDELQAAISRAESWRRLFQRTVSLMRKQPSNDLTNEDDDALGRKGKVVIAGQTGFLKDLFQPKLGNDSEKQAGLMSSGSNRDDMNDQTVEYSQSQTLTEAEDLLAKGLSLGVHCEEIAQLQEWVERCRAWERDVRSAFNLAPVDPLGSGNCYSYNEVPSVGTPQWKEFLEAAAGNTWGLQRLAYLQDRRRFLPFSVDPQAAAVIEARVKWLQQAENELLRDTLTQSTVTVDVARADLDRATNFAEAATIGELRTERLHNLVSYLNERLGVFERWIVCVESILKLDIANPANDTDGIESEQIFALPGLPMPPAPFRNSRTVTSWVKPVPVDWSAFSRDEFQKLKDSVAGNVWFQDNAGPQEGFNIQSYDDDLFMTEPGRSQQCVATGPEVLKVTYEEQIQESEFAADPAQAKERAVLETALLCLIHFLVLCSPADLQKSPLLPSVELGIGPVLASNRNLDGAKAFALLFPADKDVLAALLRGEPNAVSVSPTASFRSPNTPRLNFESSDLWDRTGRCWRHFNIVPSEEIITRVIVRFLCLWLLTTGEPGDSMSPLTYSRKRKTLFDLLINITPLGNDELGLSQLAEYLKTHDEGPRTEAPSEIEQESLANSNFVIASPKERPISFWNRSSHSLSNLKALQIMYRLKEIVGEEHFGSFERKTEKFFQKLTWDVRARAVINNLTGLPSLGDVAALMQEAQDGAPPEGLNSETALAERAPQSSLYRHLESLIHEANTWLLEVHAELNVNQRSLTEVLVPEFSRALLFTPAGAMAPVLSTAVQRILTEGNLVKRFLLTLSCIEEADGGFIYLPAALTRAFSSPGKQVSLDMDMNLSQEGNIVQSCLQMIQFFTNRKTPIITNDVMLLDLQRAGILIGVLDALFDRKTNTVPELLVSDNGINSLNIGDTAITSLNKLSPDEQLHALHQAVSLWVQCTQMFPTPRKRSIYGYKSIHHDPEKEATFSDALAVVDAVLCVWETRSVGRPYLFGPSYSCLALETLAKIDTTASRLVLASPGTKVWLRALNACLMQGWADLGKIDAHRLSRSADRSRYATYFTWTSDSAGLAEEEAVLAGRRETGKQLLRLVASQQERLVRLLKGIPALIRAEDPGFCLLRINLQLCEIFEVIVRLLCDNCEERHTLRDLRPSAILSEEIITRLSKHANSSAEGLRAEIASAYAVTRNKTRLEALFIIRELVLHLQHEAQECITLCHQTKRNMFCDWTACISSVVQTSTNEMFADFGGALVTEISCSCSILEEAAMSPLLASDVPMMSSLQDSVPSRAFSRLSNAQLLALQVSHQQLLSEWNVPFHVPVFEEKSTVLKRGPELSIPVVTVKHHPLELQGLNEASQVLNRLENDGLLAEVRRRSELEEIIGHILLLLLELMTRDINAYDGIRSQGANLQVCLNRLPPRLLEQLRTISVPQDSLIFRAVELIHVSSDVTLCSVAVRFSHSAASTESTEMSVTEPAAGVLQDNFSMGQEALDQVYLIHPRTFIDLASTVDLSTRADRRWCEGLQGELVQNFLNSLVAAAPQESWRLGNFTLREFFGKCAMVLAGSRGISGAESLLALPNDSQSDGPAIGIPAAIASVIDILKLRLNAQRFVLPGYITFNELSENVSSYRHIAPVQEHFFEVSQLLPPADEMLSMVLHHHRLMHCVESLNTGDFVEASALGLSSAVCSVLRATCSSDVTMTLQQATSLATSKRPLVPAEFNDLVHRYEQVVHLAPLGSVEWDLESQRVSGSNLSAAIPNTVYDASEIISLQQTHRVILPAAERALFLAEDLAVWESTVRAILELLQARQQVQHRLLPKVLEGVQGGSQSRSDLLNGVFGSPPSISVFNYWGVTLMTPQFVKAVWDSYGLTTALNVESPVPAEVQQVAFIGQIGKQDALKHLLQRGEQLTQGLVRCASASLSCESLRRQLQDVWAAIGHLETQAQVYIRRAIYDTKRISALEADGAAASTTPAAASAAASAAAANAVPVSQEDGMSHCDEPVSREKLELLLRQSLFADLPSVHPYIKDLFRLVVELEYLANLAFARCELDRVLSGEMFAADLISIELPPTTECLPYRNADAGTVGAELLARGPLKDSAVATIEDNVDWLTLVSIVYKRCVTCPIVLSFKTRLLQRCWLATARCLLVTGDQYGLRADQHGREAPLILETGEKVPCLHIPSYKSLQLLYAKGKQLFADVPENAVPTELKVFRSLLNLSKGFLTEARARVDAWARCRLVMSRFPVFLANEMRILQNRLHQRFPNVSLEVITQSGYLVEIQLLKGGQIRSSFVPPQHLTLIKEVPEETPRPSVPVDIISAVLQHASKHRQHVLPATDAHSPSVSSNDFFVYERVRQLCRACLRGVFAESAVDQREAALFDAANGSLSEEYFSGVQQLLLKKMLQIVQVVKGPSKQPRQGADVTNHSLEDLLAPGHTKFKQQRAREDGATATVAEADSYSPITRISTGFSDNILEPSEAASSIAPPADLQLTALEKAGFIWHGTLNGLLPGPVGGMSHASISVPCSLPMWVIPLFQPVPNRVRLICRSLDTLQFRRCWSLEGFGSYAAAGKTLEGRDALFLNVLLATQWTSDAVIPVLQLLRPKTIALLPGGVPGDETAQQSALIQSLKVLEFAMPIPQNLMEQYSQQTFLGPEEQNFKLFLVPPNPTVTEPTLPPFIPKSSHLVFGVLSLPSLAKTEVASYHESHAENLSLGMIRSVVSNVTQQTTRLQRKEIPCDDPASIPPFTSLRIGLAPPFEFVKVPEKGTGPDSAGPHNNLPTQNSNHYLPDDKMLASKNPSRIPKRPRLSTESGNPLQYGRADVSWGPPTVPAPPAPPPLPPWKVQSPASRPSPSLLSKLGATLQFRHENSLVPGPVPPPPSSPAGSDAVSRPVADPYASGMKINNPVEPDAEAGPFQEGSRTLPAIQATALLRAGNSIPGDVRDSHSGTNNLMMTSQTQAGVAPPMSGVGASNGMPAAVPVHHTQLDVATAAAAAAKALPPWQKTVPFIAPPPPPPPPDPVFDQLHACNVVNTCGNEESSVPVSSCKAPSENTRLNAAPTFRSGGVLKSLLQGAAAHLKHRVPGADDEVQDW